LPAEIVKQTSKYLYVVNVNGRNRVVHKNQMRYPKNIGSIDSSISKLPMSVRSSNVSKKQEEKCVNIGTSFT
jgi:hypothetical protein